MYYTLNHSLGTPVVPFFLFLWVSLLKLNSRKKATFIVKVLLGNLVVGVFVYSTMLSLINPSPVACIVVSRVECDADSYRGQETVSEYVYIYICVYICIYIYIYVYVLTAPVNFLEIPRFQKETDYWNFQKLIGFFLEFSNFGILEFRNFRILEFGNFRILEFWNFRILEFWNFGISQNLTGEFWNFRILQFLQAIFLFIHLTLTNNKKPL